MSIKDLFDLPCPRCHGTGRIPANAGELTWHADVGFMGITDADLHRWNQAYPACDIHRQLAAAHEWLLANPSKAKKRNYRRFITNWLSRQQERGGDATSNKPKSEAARKREIWEQKWEALRVQLGRPPTDHEIMNYREPGHGCQPSTRGDPGSGLRSGPA